MFGISSHAIGGVFELGIVELQVSCENLAIIARKSQGVVEIGLKLRALQQAFVL